MFDLNKGPRERKKWWCRLEIAFRPFQTSLIAEQRPDIMVLAS